MPVPGSDDTYQITIYKNSLESNAGADRSAEKAVQELLAETGCTDFEILGIDRQKNPMHKDIYRVKVLRNTAPREMTFAQRVGELTADVLFHIDIPAAGVKLVNRDTDEVFTTVADKDGWVLIELPRGTFFLGEVEVSDYSRTKTYGVRNRLEVKRTDGILYAGHVHVFQGGSVSNEIEQARLVFNRLALGERTVHAALMRSME